MNTTSPCYFTARPDGQYVVSYEICNVCNLKCKHCMNRSSQDAFAGLPFSRIKNLLTELHDNNIRYLYISGGEPLLHPDFDEIISCAHDLGFQMMLATNGLEISKHIDSIEKCIQDVSISLDGIGLIHDQLRGVDGAFDKVMETIDLLHSRNIYTRISTCLWKNNVLQLEDIAELAVQKNLKKINFSILVPIGRTTENDVMLEMSEYPKLIRRIDKLREKHQIAGKTEIVLRRNRPLSAGSIDCFGGDTIFHIDARGRISPCSWCSKADKDNVFSMQWSEGNLTECIEKCHKIHPVLQARKEKYGYTGCPAIAYFQNGDVLGEDPLNRIFTEE